MSAEAPEVTHLRPVKPRKAPPLPANPLAPESKSEAVENVWDVLMYLQWHKPEPDFCHSEPENLEWGRYWLLQMCVDAVKCANEQIND